LNQSFATVDTDIFGLTSPPSLSNVGKYSILDIGILSTYTR
jgi:hypothetical protein